MEIAFPPDFKIYPQNSGPYVFNLKAGEETDHWIEIGKGSYGYSVKSEDDKFVLKYFDGEVVEAWTPGSWPAKYKFKIKAITDQNVVLVVK